MEEFVSVHLDLQRSDELEARVVSFRRRANDLLSFIRSRSWGQHTVSINRDDENRPRIRGTMPDELALEGLYRRFRFFILNNEKSNYRRLTRLLPQYSESYRLALYCRSARKEFLQEEILQFAFVTANDPIGAEELIDYWFNAFYFHDHADKRKKLDEVTERMTENGAKVALWHTVWNASMRVRNLAYLLRETNQEHPEMYVPILCRVYG